MMFANNCTGSQIYRNLNVACCNGCVTAANNRKYSNDAHPEGSELKLV